MAGQGTDRREVMRIMAIASVAGAFPGFERWGFACGRPTQSALASKPIAGSFRPQFFTPDEFRMIERLVDLIMPADGHPGAREAGVAEFIDFMVAIEANLSGRSGRPIKQRFRSGLDWMDERSQSLCGNVFVECTEKQQIDLLEHLAYRARFRKGEEVGQQFFHLVRDYTVKGYYTSRVGLESLGYPGLRTMWAEMPGCPHPDDPEHVHLPPPAA